MPILDDIMLRIHTVLIIGSYAVITLAFAVANCYLIVAGLRDRARVAQGTLGAELGAVSALVLARLGFFDGFSAGLVVAGFAGCILAGMLLALAACTLLPGGRRPDAGTPLSSGLAPSIGQDGILVEFDKSHRVLLYTSMVALFVGLVLGAVWADYSWGRPWGWDPKEVFALNTWLVYAILIHVGLVTRRRALWTSVLSVCGFATMQFNWWVVNFYIVGLHSYA
jgi:ABC-type transport system involved in cytochrome c biogenesis permease subunit